MTPPLPGERPLDWWSFAHFGAGLLLALFIPTWWLMATLVIGYEFIEAGLRRIPAKGRGKGLFEYESWANIFADVVLGAMGWGVGRLVGVQVLW